MADSEERQEEAQDRAQDPGPDQSATDSPAPQTPEPTREIVESLRMGRRQRSPRQSASPLAGPEAAPTRAAGTVDGPAPSDAPTLLKSPTEAAIFIDGESTGLETPVESHFLWPSGKRSIALKKEGYDPVERELKLDALSREKLALALMRDHGYLALETWPPGTMVTFFIDGKPHPGAEFLCSGQPDEEAGRDVEPELPQEPDSTPPDRNLQTRWFKLPKGTQKIEISRENYETITDAIFIAADHAATVRRNLAHNTGFLTVSCNVPGVTMKADLLMEESDIEERQSRTLQIPRERNQRWDMPYLRRSRAPLEVRDRLRGLDTPLII